MNTHHQDNTTKVIHGDCIETMNAMPPESVDAIVTDPPYGLGFMGKKWDGLPPSLEWAEACYRVLKPGGHIAAFGGTRTWHRLAVAIEDAGFEMRDSLAWLYGSGFPKSHDVGKSIDKQAGKQREVVGKYARPDGTDRDYTDWKINSGAWKEGSGFDPSAREITAPATPEAAQWEGWGTALKPAFEPIVLARKPIAEKTVARNVLAHGTGAINIDGCRIGMSDADRAVVDSRSGAGDTTEGWGNIGKRSKGQKFKSAPSGRWPANVLLDQHAATWVDEQAGGGASRFFYTAKAPKRERPNVDGVQHPTVKPLAIMEWLIRLTTPPGGTVLDPFAGSGTTLEAARKLGHKSIGIEAEETYLPLIDQRLQRSNTGPIEREGIGE